MTGARSTPCLGPSELKRINPLEEENHRFKKLAAGLQARYGTSERQACAVLQLSRASYRYQSVARDSLALSMKICEINHTWLH